MVHHRRTNRLPTNRPNHHYSATTKKMVAKLMALKKQTPSSIQTINTQIKAWLRWQTELVNEQKNTDRWYLILKERNACMTIIMGISGLNLEQTYDLVYNKTNTSSYWLPNGTIRKEHP